MKEEVHINAAEFSRLESGLARRIAGVMIPAGLTGLVAVIVPFGGGEGFQDWREIIIAVSVFCIAFPVLWLCALKVATRWPISARLSALFTLALVPVCLWVFDSIGRMDACQHLLWHAVQMRSLGDDWFVRDLSTVRLQHARHARDMGHVVMVGSSQLDAAVDRERMADILSPVTLEMKTIGDLDPAKACVAQDYLFYAHGALYVFMLSERDIRPANPWVMSNWMRPLCTRRGLTQFLRAQAWAQALRNWKEGLDLGMAAHSTLWRDRDYLRLLVFNPFASPMYTPRRNLEQARIQEQLDLQWQALSASGTEWIDVHLRALDAILRRLDRQGCRAVILQGQMNPRMASEDWQLRREGVDRELVRLARRHGHVRYIPLREQAVDISADEWRDLTHVNTAGRFKYTQYIASVVNEELTRMMRPGSP